MRLNEKLIDLLEELSIISSKMGENNKSLIYKKAQSTLYNINEDITDLKQLEGKPFIGKVIMEKFELYLRDGKLDLIERFKSMPENILIDIYGIGPSKAKELVSKGINSIEKLRENQDLLNEKQKIGLKYYEDILKRIPRGEIETYNNLFEKSFEKVKDENTKYEIVGSYRRGALNSGDIDVIITSDDINKFNIFLDDLIEKKIIIEVLSRGSHKSLVICKLSDNDNARRVDFLYTTSQEYPFAVLYFTGSKGFNTVMRGYALKQGLSLNEHGISRKIGGKKEEKLELNIKTEKDIFDYFGLEYKKPEERINGSAVVLKSGENIENLNKTKKSSQKVKKNLTKKNKSPVKNNESIYDKYLKMKKEDLINELSLLLNLPDKLNNLCELKTKESLIKRIIEVKQEKNNVEVERIEIRFEKKEEKSNKSSRKKEKKSPKNKTKRNNLKENSDNNKMKKRTKKEILEMMNNFKNEGITYIEKLSEKELGEIIILANKEFHSYGESDDKKVTLNDSEYDIIYDYTQNKYPESEVFNKIGAEFEKNKVDLPVNMPSMNKIKPTTNAVSEWKQKYKGKYVLSCKLDGVSGLYYSMNGEQKMYTRGDGSVGQDVSHLIKYVTGIPNKMNVIVRGEFLISKDKFEKKYKEKFSNARNLVAGIVNSKKVDNKAKDVDFVSYELIEPEVKPSKQMELLKEYGFNVVKNSVVEEIDNDKLSNVLLDYRNNYDYVIDGVIVSDDNIYTRKNKNPEHSFAFKMVLSDQVVESKVLDVIWTASKSGYLKPRVRIEPVNIGGVKIEYATGFNGKFVKDNGIGIGAIIQLVRSGDVIPHIKGVTTPADKPKMPNVEYTWTSTNVDIILANKDDDKEVLLKNITAFFTTLDVESLSSGNVKRLIQGGYNSIPKILKMKLEDFTNIEGFKEKLSKKIHDSIKEKVTSASFIKIAAASNKLGRGIGEKKIKPILEKYPNFFTRKETNEEKKQLLLTVNGIGKENAESIVTNTKDLLEFLQQSELMYKLEEKVEEKTVIVSEDMKSHPLYNKKIVMSKIRDKEIIDFLSKYNGNLVDSIKKDVFALIVKSKTEKSNKMIKAEELKIQIMTPDEFKDAYMK
jgi:NAD-dependent DNA ligase/DNA polymerase/3'-5' exonuclease PolX